MNTEEVKRRAREFDDLAGDLKQAAESLHRRGREAEAAARFYEEAEYRAINARFHGRDNALTPKEWQEAAAVQLAAAIEAAASTLDGLPDLVTRLQHANSHLRLAARGVDTRGE